MSTAFHRLLTEKVTYWPPGVPDGFGGSAFNDAQHLDARWEFRSELIRTPDGKERLTRIRVFLSEDVVIGGYIKLGEFQGVSPHDTEEAYQILDFKKIPDIKGKRFVRMAML